MGVPRRKSSGDISKFFHTDKQKIASYRFLALWHSMALFFLVYLLVTIPVELCIIRERNLNSGLSCFITTVIRKEGSANLCISIQETLRLAESKCNVA